MKLLMNETEYRTLVDVLADDDLPDGFGLVRRSGGEYELRLPKFVEPAREIPGMRTIDVHPASLLNHALVRVIGRRA